MTYEDRLKNRVRALRRAAKDLYHGELDDQGIDVDEDGRFHEGDKDFEGDQYIELAAEERPKYLAFVRDLDDLVERFERYYELNHRQFAGRMTALGGAVYDSYPFSVYGKIRDASDEWMEPVLSLVRGEQWTGAAAGAFCANFLAPFNRSSELLMACVREMTLILECYRATSEHYEEQFVLLAETATAKFKEEDQGPTLAAALNVVSMVATAVGVVLAIPTGGLSLGLGVVSLGAGAGSMIYSAATDDGESEPEPLEIEGDSAREILDSTIDAMSKLEVSLADIDSGLHRAMRRDLENSSSFDSLELELGRPAIADFPDSFEDLEISVRPGVDIPINENPVVETMVDLYKAGQVYLPNAADLYNRAAENMRDLTIPSKPNAMYSMSRRPFLEMRNLLAGILSRTQDAIIDSANALTQVAQNYEITDEERAEAFRQIGEILPPQSDAVGFPT